MKVSEKSILGDELIRQVNQGLRESLKVDQKLVDLMTTEEHVTAVKESLDTLVEGINNLRRNHATVDPDVMEAFRTLVQDIRSFNEHNGTEVIPMSREVDDILAGAPFATTGSGYHNTNSTNHVSYGEDNHGHGHYHAMGEHHPLVGVTHENNGCCGGCVMM